MTATPESTPSAGTLLATPIFNQLASLRNAAATIYGWDPDYCRSDRENKVETIAQNLDDTLEHLRARLAKNPEHTTSFLEPASGRKQFDFTWSWRQAFSCEATLYLKFHLEVAIEPSKRNGGNFTLQLKCVTESTVPSTCRTLAASVAITNLMARVNELAATAEVGLTSFIRVPITPVTTPQA
jgi:hypothetical protein